MMAWDGWNKMTMAWKMTVPVWPVQQHANWLAPGLDSWPGFGWLASLVASQDLAWLAWLLKMPARPEMIRMKLIT